MTKAPFSLPFNHATIAAFDESGRPIQVARLSPVDYRNFFDPHYVSEVAIRNNMMGIYMSLPSRYERVAHA